MITNLEIIMFYLASIMIVYSIPKIIKAIGKVKQWKEAYNKQERISKFIEEFDNSMSNIESRNDVDKHIKEAILYD